MLNSDQLGEFGQSHFRTLCAEAGLICNEATRDRTGWDFIVEFPFPAPENMISVDGRLIPTSCYIQVKTLWERNNTIKLRLSSLERLAKVAQPSFIYIFKVSSSCIFLDSFLIHLIDDPLGVILKKLRQEQAAGRQSEINHRTL